MKYILVGLALLLSHSFNLAFAEDIELYVGNEIERTGERPQVLIIFDTSGSMATNETIIASYDPNTDYGKNNYVYYSSNSNVPNIGSNKRFLIDDNGCASSHSALNNIGFYNGKLKYYKPKQGLNRNGSKKKGSWKNLSGSLSLANGNYIDCDDDIKFNNLKNGKGVPDGLPSNVGSDLKNPPPYDTSPSKLPSFSQGITLYSSNYVQWYHNASSTRKSRLEIAKETVTNLIESAPGVSFGLEVFNQNNHSSTDGGRIAYGIKDEDNYNSQTVIDLINDKITANGNTPLCESLYEAALYFGGKNILNGDKGGNKKPEKDTKVSNNGEYNSPFAGCSNEIYVILMTDGKPVSDGGVDSYVNQLNPGGSGNRLDELAEWMHNNDINDKIDGVQTATIFTIGFGQNAVDDAGELLTATAEKGGGKYYPAADPSQLLNSLQSALLEILKVSTSFTSPSIASNNFDRTETLDSVYYAMFLPNEGPRWSGNLKKLKIVGDTLVDQDGDKAINTQGNIDDNAQTFWTLVDADGPEVQAGGVAEMLRTKTTRKLYSDIGENNALVDFTYANAKSFFKSDSELADHMNTDESTLVNNLKWAQGLDVDDENNDTETDDIRSDIFGDPLHSKPLVVNYGGSKDNQDIRIIIGTNAGFLHMFQDKGNVVDENWAFIPNELYPNIPILRENAASESKVYGIDGSPTVHIVDVKGDGTVDTDDGDTAWLFFGLRRGGNSYYAIDISNPDQPEFMWKVDSDSTNFDELGQSWGRVKIGYSKINVENDVAKPVAFISGGYDTNKDTSGKGTEDNIGRGVFMLDAATGTLLWSATPAATSNKNIQWSNLTDSIPSSLSIMDSDSDGMIDRLYTGDTGGNVWRIDMPGSSPKSTESPWTITQMAKLAGDSDTNDYRFFDQPTVARTILTDTVSVNVDGETNPHISRYERRYDAILLGSGDRTSPRNTETNDKFFMIKDPNIITQSFGVDGNPFPTVITESNLSNFTANPYGSVNSTQQKETLDLQVSGRSGWYVDFLSSGEKSTAAGTVLAGVAYFNSFTPADNSGNNQCVLNAGEGRLYAINLATGANVYDWRTLDIGDRVPDTPTVVIPPEEPTEDTNGDGVIDENDSSKRGTLILVGVGNGTGSGTITPCEADNCDIDAGIQLQTIRTHLYIEEEN